MKSDQHTEEEEEEEDRSKQASTMYGVVNSNRLLKHSSRIAKRDTGK